MKNKIKYKRVIPTCIVYKKDGRAVKIEIKCRATKDRQSADQRKYQQQVEQAGAVYIIVRDFKEYFVWLNDFTNEQD